MVIQGKVYCFFEQSGVFRDEFIKLGLPAFDYDIMDNYGQTNCVIDLFEEIERGYKNQSSIFDNITPDDLILAFFPCTYFTGSSNPLEFSFSSKNYENFDNVTKTEIILSRNLLRNKFYEILLKFTRIIYACDLRLIIENPYSRDSFLYNNFVCPPAVIDSNRRLRGDYFKKPTGYWFLNCKPTYGKTFVPQKIKKKIHSVAGGNSKSYSEPRSLISSMYAKNFICDFIIGKESPGTQTGLPF